MYNRELNRQISISCSKFRSPPIVDKYLSIIATKRPSGLQISKKSNIQWFSKIRTSRQIFANHGNQSMCRVVNVRSFHLKSHIVKVACLLGRKPAMQKCCQCYNGANLPNPHVTMLQCFNGATLKTNKQTKWSHFKNKQTNKQKWSHLTKSSFLFAAAASAVAQQCTPFQMSRPSWILRKFKFGFKFKFKFQKHRGIKGKHTQVLNARQGLILL